MTKERAALSIKLFQCAEILHGTNETQKSSACIIMPPRIERCGIQFDSIRLLLGYHENPHIRKYIMYHEIAHLLSIGPVQTVTNEQFVRRWGLCKTVYMIKGQEIQISVDYENASDNERMNDCLALELFSHIEQTPPNPRWGLRRGQFAKMPQERIIKYYLANGLPSVGTDEIQRKSV